MNDGELLLKAIMKNPDDDTTRLIYADWLEENGQCERGEFIRVQVALSRPTLCEGTSPTGIACSKLRPRGKKDCLPWCKPCCDFDDLKKREQQLVWSHDTDWRADFARQIGDNHDHYYAVAPEWERGFVSHVTCTWEDWLKHGDAILAAEPVREVTLTTEPPEYAVQRFMTVGAVAKSERWKGVLFNFHSWYVRPIRQINQDQTSPPVNYLNPTEIVQ